MKIKTPIPAFGKMYNCQTIDVIYREKPHAVFTVNKSSGVTFVEVFS